MNASHPLRATVADAPEIKVSFEFFPPKTDATEQSLWKAIERLGVLEPEFVSVTYGAGGSTRERTHNTVARIEKETSLVAAAHLTCVGATKAEVDEVIRAYRDAGVRHIVALRGDPPEGVEAAYAPHPGGYENGANLVGGIRAIGDFEISVSAYPEKHPDSPDVATDLDMLKAKLDAGATRAITQFFFNNEHYYRYLDRLEKHGIDIPVVPGVLPVSNFAVAARFAGICGTEVPDWFAARFEGLEDDPETRRLVAATVVAEQVFDLVEKGVEQFHFYTLNRAELVHAACHLLGIRPTVDAAA